MSAGEIVLVTTYQRNELLYLCLEAIRREDSDIDIDVASDRGHSDEELEAICWQFDTNLTVTGACGYGNSFNTLASMRVCMNRAEIVHSIEDDTILHPGYLKWARSKLLAAPGLISPYAAVCGRIASPHISNWYEAPCASWNSTFLRIALSHVKNEYFASTREEMQRVLDEEIFPDSKYKKGGAEQDGFLLRCIEHYHWRTCFPPKPLATHLGWYGYNSPPLRERPTGDLKQRVEACRAMLKNVEQRRFLFGHRITDAEVSGINGL